MEKLWAALASNQTLNELWFGVRSSPPSHPMCTPIEGKLILLAQHIWIRPHSIAIVAEALKLNGTLQILELSVRIFIFFHCFSKLKWIDIIKFAHIECEGAVLLANALKINESLEFLNLEVYFPSELPE